MIPDSEPEEAGIFQRTLMIENYMIFFKYVFSLFYVIFSNFQDQIMQKDLED
jgi:hypothetical protein